MDVGTACKLLGDAGFPVECPDALHVEARDDRELVMLPDDRIAWFPTNPVGARRLAAERRILDLLKAHCTFRVPHVLHASEAGWQLRDLVPGLCDPWGLYRRTRADRTLARRIGDALGAILGEQHGRLCSHDIDWLPRRTPWPESDDRLWQTLPLVLAGNIGLLRPIERVMRRYRDQEEDAACDRVLVHGDLGLHNIAILPGTDTVSGVFDYDSAAWADRHQDFRYLVFDDMAGHEDLLDGALQTYEPIAGLRLDRDRIRLCNAACAIGFLANRFGTPADVRSCGRTLAEDLAWIGQALRDTGEA